MAVWRHIIAQVLQQASSRGTREEERQKSAINRRRKVGRNIIVSEVAAVCDTARDDVHTWASQPSFQKTSTYEREVCISSTRCSDFMVSPCCHYSGFGTKLLLISMALQWSNVGDGRAEAHLV